MSKYAHYKDKARRKRYLKKYVREHRAEIAAYKKLWAQRNKDKVAVSNRKWTQANPKKHCARVKRYQQAHPERVSARKKRYNQTEAGKMSSRANNHNQRIKRASIGHMSIKVVRQVYSENIAKYQILTCELCFTPVISGQDSVEHFIPIKRGGTHKRTNLGIAHDKNSAERCNQRKNNLTLKEWFKLHPEYKKRIR